MMPANERVIIELGGLLNKPTDLCILPRSAQGTISPAIIELAKGFDIPLRQDASPLGDLIVEPVVSPKAMCRKVGWATSVSRNLSHIEAIRSIFASLAVYLDKDEEVGDVQTPLLGTGAGGLKDFDVYRAVVEEMNSSNSAARIRIMVNEESRYEDLINTISSSQEGGAPAREARDTYLLALPSSTISASEEYFRTFFDHFREGGYITANWDVGRELKKDDRVFLMRRGDLAGLVGSGTVVSTEAASRKKGEARTHADIDWDYLAPTPLIDVQTLEKQIDPRIAWQEAENGEELPAETALRLEKMWGELREAPQSMPPLLPPHAWVETDSISTEAANFLDRDRLDLKDQAGIFAALLVAQSIHPPLALCLLGDWGVGKTFFMRLMQENIQLMTGKGGASTAGEGAVTRAVQIEFNAWHYVDSDLWASLASHIFNGLTDNLAGKAEKPAQARQQLRSKISSSALEKEQAEGAIEVAKAKRQEAVAELQKHERDRAKAKADYEADRLQRVWEAVMTVNASGKDDKTFQSLKQDAERTAKELGITDVIDSATEARRVYLQLRQIYSKRSGVNSLLATLFSGKQLWMSLGVLAACTGLAVAIPLLLRRFAGDQETVRAFVAPVLQLTTVLGGISAWVGKKLSSVSAAITYLDKVQTEMHNRSLIMDTVSRAETQASKNLKKADAEIATQQRKIEEADRQISAAQAEIQRIDSGGLVYDFLQGKAADSRYLDRLGLISVIRQDFEKLKKTLVDWQENYARTATKRSDTDTRPVERIILYIDDLDRCPPKRVVEVLQAVHLLLAFDLFVVVVAVDSRWLERSLNEEYNPDGAKERPNEPVHRFSAHNYLEKIFQIPFTLPAMTAETYGALVLRMINEPREAALKRSAEASGETKPFPPQDAGTGVEKKTAASQAQNTSGETPDGKGEGGQQPPPKEVTKADGVEKDDELEKKARFVAEQRIKAMILHEYEQQFITGLFPFIGTPRKTKAFINIYRLIRVNAFSMKEHPSYLDKENGQYRIVLTLLAISLGVPVAPRLLPVFRVGLEMEAGGGTFTEILKNWCDALAIPVTDTNDLLEKVDQTIFLLKEKNAGSIENDMTRYRDFVDIVSRYTFYCGEASSSR
ncbi:hypothetical protein GMSM_20940 [Geomonas sp. Red276]